MKSLSLVVLFAVGALGSVLPSAEHEAFWLKWKQVNGKEYNSVLDETQRRTIWETNLKKIDSHNQDYSLGKTTFLMAMNEFGDLVSIMRSLFLKRMKIHFRLKIEFITCNITV